MTTTTTKNNNNNNNKPQADGRYAVDVRLLFMSVFVAMIASFLAGAGIHEVPSSFGALEGARGGEGGGVASSSGPTETSTPVANTDAEHQPAGQHLLVDMAGVERDFLDSEERLAKAMVDTVLGSGLTLLSYHCHKLSPAGISCAGVLLESHISFHTWPDEGVITLDLFTCGPKPLIPVVEVIQKLFGIKRADVAELKTRWSHELRGFRTEDHYLDHSSDLALWVLSPLEMYSKKQIFSNSTKYQRVDIWDTVEINERPHYEDIRKHNLTPGDPRLATPELASPSRYLFLDGTLQSFLPAEEVYHEAVVHPAMFAHSKPKNIAIVGGAEGATLREVLKHNTVESVTMVEIDEELVDIVLEFMPTMSNCSDLLGRADNCFEDDLVTTVYEDVTKWIISHAGTGRIPEKLFDILIVDALDPEEGAEMADGIYSNIDVIDAFVRSLSDDGVMVLQIGTAATIHDPRPDKGIYARREAMFKLFEEHSQVEAMLVYEEPNCGFLEPHAFLIVCKSAECRSRWYARSDQVEYQIYDRIVRTKSKKRALSYFDGTTQRSYQWPKKGWETVYCRREPEPFECAYRRINPKAERHEFDPEDEEESSFRIEAKKNEEGKTVETHVYATCDILKGAFIMPDHLAASLEITERNLEALQHNAENGGGSVAVIEDLLEFFDDYGHRSAMDGSNLHFVEVGASILIKRVEHEAEANIQRWVPQHPSGKRPKYSPVYERRRLSFDVLMVASADIPAGGELLMYKEMW